MPSQRQQRAARNRRVVIASTPAKTGTLAPVISSIALGVLELQGLVIAQPPALSGTAVPLVLSSQPQIRRTRDGSLPTLWTLLPDGLTLHLEYAAPGIDASDSFWVGPDDPAVRTATGGFLAPGVIESPTPLPPAEPTAAVSAAATGANEVTATVTPSGGRYCLLNQANWRKGPANTFPTNVVAPAAGDNRSPFTLILTYPDAVNVGESFNWDGPALAVGNTGIQTPTLTPVLLT